MLAFSSGFKQPAPPLIKPDFSADFVQHKWDETLSHIMTGYIRNSPAKNTVRVHEVFDDALASSLFDYSNATADGLVDNTLTTYRDNATQPDVWRGYVNSNYPLFAADMLRKTGAVFGGLVERRFTDGRVAAVSAPATSVEPGGEVLTEQWNIMYQSVIPVTVYVSSCGVVVGYDYFSPGRRTRVVTELFNIRA
ncbi:GTP binding protein and negative regulator of the Ran/Tc4 GTPase cycle, Gtr1p [Purpureocillium lavendulum]|uniref:GTP binding protein and negative regulator of the Ran/Tc4 GTPase cycle, Gtr1p n=1 Tax=Purpureocillium lavendulum TaxID=1247861 RepID=A0AB34FSN3_9HYPO|nr:GTP binding protein and negative regulator of the Ran/Tc4 GTPase cycle, Gtr1p [Purpureocillium lavendulum]